MGNQALLIGKFFVNFISHIADINNLENRQIEFG